MTQALSVSPQELRPNTWNTNVVSPENEAKLDAAIKRFGFFKPIVVREYPDDDTRYEIIGGQHRWESAVRLGIKTIPIMNVGNISDIEAKEISLADNSRYGSDDTISLAELLSEMGNTAELSDFLPYTDAEFNSIFSSVDIALEDLDLEENFDSDTTAEEPRQLKAPKTHTIMRFKISLEDAEKLTALITKAQKRYGFSSSDELTNAGDALIHLLFSDNGDSE